MDIRESVRNYFAVAVVPKPHMQQAVTTVIRPLLKWWLENVRNVLVVSGLFYLAQRSGNTVLIIFAWINVLALYCYVQTYLETWTFFPFPHLKASKRSAQINRISSWVIFGLVILIWVVAANALFDSLQHITPK